jgi:hypothetical protein
MGGFGTFLAVSALAAQNRFPRADTTRDGV